MKEAQGGSIQNVIQKVHPRTRKAQLNVIWGLLIKGSGIIISLLLVPLSIDYLSKETYGMWLTISSLTTMLVYFDVGIGNGLRNKLAEAVSKKKYRLAQTYVSTAYYLYALGQIVFIGLFVVVAQWIPWQKFFNTTLEDDQLQWVVSITVVAMSIRLVLELLTCVLLALQEPAQASFLPLIANFLTLIGTYCLNRYTNPNLIAIALVTYLSPLLILLTASFIFYRTKLKPYKPVFDLVKLSSSKDILSLGYQFFFVQISIVVLLYTDNIIITQLFGSAEVTTYNIAFRYFNVINSSFAILMAPYWSAFTDAFVKNDYEWMQRTYKYLKYAWLGLIIIVIIMIIISEHAYHAWIGNRDNVPLQLSIGMGTFVIISCWNSINAAVTNGIGKVRLQVWYSLFSALFNIPLSIFLGETLGMRSTGIILATCVSLLLGSIVGAVQVNKLIYGTATGIWIK